MPLELHMAEWERQDEIFDRINPRSALLRLGQWWRCDTGHWIIRPNVINSYLQRARHGYSDRDTWDLPAHLAEVIAGSVERFAQLTNGHPAELEPHEWDDILNRISGGIRSAVQRLDDIHLDKQGQAQAKADLDDSLRLLSRWLAPPLVVKGKSRWRACRLIVPVRSSRVNQLAQAGAAVPSYQAGRGTGEAHLALPAPPGSGRLAAPLAYTPPTWPPPAAPIRPAPQ